MRHAETYRGKRRNSARRMYHDPGNSWRGWIEFWQQFKIVRRNVKRKAKR